MASDDQPHPMDIPPRFQSRAGIRFIMDTCVVDERTAGMDQLRQWHEEGWIDLHRTDTMDVELLTAKADRRPELLAESSKYVEALGHLVRGQSRIDHSVFGSPLDRDRLARVFSELFPGADATATTPNNVRDAMHVHSAIRYAYDGFLTRDRRLLNKTNAIRTEFNGFLIIDPEHGAEIVRRRIVEVE